MLAYCIPEVVLVSSYGPQSLAPTRVLGAEKGSVDVHGMRQHGVFVRHHQFDIPAHLQ